MTWAKNPEARKQVILAMSTKKKPTTVAVIAAIVHKSGPTVNQMLKALAADGVVALGVAWPGQPRTWRLTGKPLPVVNTSTSAAVLAEFSTVFDHRALTAAWPPTPHLSTTTTIST